MPIIHAKDGKCQYDCLHRDKRFARWIEVPLVITSWEIWRKLQAVTSQCLNCIASKRNHYKIHNNIWRLGNLDETKKINLMDPNNVATTHGETTPPNLQLSKQNTTLLLGAEVPQKGTKAKGKKIKEEVIIPYINKRKITLHHFQTPTGDDGINYKRKKVNQADVCEAKRVKMKRLFPQEENLTRSPTEASSKLSTKPNHL